MTHDKLHPTQELMRRDEDKMLLLESLGEAFDALGVAAETYRQMFKNAKASGWAHADLVRSGFTDPKKLPTITRYSTNKNPTTLGGVTDAQ